MTPVWVVPVVVLLLGAVALTALLRSTTESARELANEVIRFGELHVRLAGLRDEVARGAGAWQDLRSH